MQDRADDSYRAATMAMLVCAAHASLAHRECLHHFPCSPLQSGDLNAAVSASTRALSMSSSHVKCLLLRAAAYRGLGKLDQSMLDIESAAACKRVKAQDAEIAAAAAAAVMAAGESEAVTVATLLARTKMLSDTDEVMGMDDPDIARQRNLTLNAMAIRLRVEGRHDDAVRLFTQIVAADPGCVQFLVNRADCLLENNKLLKVRAVGWPLLIELSSVVVVCPWLFVGAG